MRPSFLPKSSYEDGIIEEARTLVVIPTLLPDAQRVEELVHQLEVHYLSNKEENLYFALLEIIKMPGKRTSGRPANWEAAQADSPTQSKILPQGKNFYLFLRERTFIPQEKRWMGWKKTGRHHGIKPLSLHQDPGTFEKIWKFMIYLK